MIKKSKCSVCGKYYTGKGRDAWPVTMGKCCDKCRDTKVASERLRRMFAFDKGERIDY